MGKWSYRSTILILGTMWRLVLDFTPLPLFSSENSPLYQFYGMPHGPQRRSGIYGEEKNILLLLGIELLLFVRPFRSLLAI
jgi:hypothetical protein